MQQGTIAQPVEAYGLGLHSGARVGLRLEPAEGGIVFAMACGAEIPALYASVRSGARATVLGASTSSDQTVATVEHLLAVLSVLGIDSVRIHVEGPELPAFDGSARDFFELVSRAGRRETSIKCAPIKLVAPIEIREGDRFIRAEPAEEFGFHVGIDFPHVAIGRQVLTCASLSAEEFEQKIAPARTFGFLSEVEALRAAGLAKGASFENTLVLGDQGLLNEDGLRFEDEFVRHKTLDLLGDLALLGAPLEAFVTVEKGGHRLHHKLVEAILERARNEPTRPLPEALGFLR